MTNVCVLSPPPHTRRILYTYRGIYTYKVNKIENH